MSLKLPLTLLAIVSGQPLAFADDFAKNGLPCVSEICIGDGVEALRKVPWDKAKKPYSTPEKPVYTADSKFSDDDVRYVNTQFKGGTTAAVPYLSDKLFDAESLDALARVSAACAGVELVGAYTTKSGNPTKVGITMSPGQGTTTSPQWMVTRIYRSFPSAVTEEQKAAVKAELLARYKAFTKAKTPKPGDGLASVTAFGSAFGLQLSLFQGLEAENQRKQHPLCGGAAKVKID